MNSKKIVLGLITLFICKTGFAQSTSDKLPSISIGTGVLTYYGNVGQSDALSSFSKIRAGFQLSLEERLGKVFSLRATGLFGKLAESERSITNNLNFESPIQQGDLSLIFRTDELFPNANFTPFIGTGVGYLGFNPYGDLRAADGEKYYYWSDGSIMNAPQGSANAKPLQRDYVYETKLDSTGKYAHTSLIIPITVGFNLKILDNFSAAIGATYFLTFTNAIDNVNAGKKDAYLYTNVSLTYKFGHADKTADNKGPENKRYAKVNFAAIDNGDSDGDGVKDSKDKCPGTPKSVKVDADGCPLDSDGDGIPDYLDKEPNSKKGAVVDANGITQTDEMLAKKQAEWDAGAAERSQAFNANPSQTTIQQIEQKAIENKKENGNSKSLPAEFQSADYNKDGFIQVGEINQTIDGFFSGENDFTVEKINRLIDFFFEQ